MSKLNPNSNNNKYVQMKQSAMNERSYGSEYSDVLSLTSNNSENMVNNSQNQLKQFKQKISHLLGTNMSHSLEDLYFTIKQKVDSKFIESTSKQFNAMETTLGRVKKNNRQMAKLVTVLGTKSQKQHAKYNKKESNNSQYDKKQNKYTNSERQLQQQFYNYQYKKSQIEKNQQNDQNGKGSHKNKYKKEQNQRIRYLKPQVRSSFEQEYRWKNRIYEQKVKEMLKQLGNIKNELNKNHQYHHHHQQNVVRNINETNNNQTRNSFAARLTKQQQPQEQLKIIQQKRGNINMLLNPKIAVSEQISIENINSQSEQNIEDQKKKINYYKNSIQTANSESAQKIINHFQANQNHKEKQKKQPTQGNTFLIEKAKSISKKLEQIKAELTQTTSRTPYHSIIQTGQKSNIELLDSNNFKSPTYNQFLESYPKKSLFKKSSENLEQKDISHDESSDNEKSQHPISIEKLQDRPLPKHRLSKKKSVLDEMKNVESKMIISQKNLQENVKWDLTKNKNHKRVQTPNFSTLSNLNTHSQSISKPNISNSFTRSNEKQPHIVSYSVLNPSNSFKNLPHNTSIMNYRPPINKQPSHSNNSFIYNGPYGPYQTSHVFPVTKFNKHQILENHALNRPPSQNQMAYPPLIVQRPHYQNVGPIMNRSGSNIKIGRSVSEKRLANHSINLPFQNLPQKNATSPGIGISKMTDSSKVDPFIVTLGSSSKKIRQTSHSKDSKDLTKSKGIQVYSKQNQ